MSAEFEAHESETASIARVFTVQEAAGYAGPAATAAAASTPQGPQALFRYRYLKRGMDIVLVLLSAPFVLFLIGLAAAAVRLTSPGPVFFSHRRIRRHGAFFTMWKFRTMCVNSAEVLENYLNEHPEARKEWRESHKLRHDPRITRVGAFLRRTSLDELPQLWNVLTGSMTLVGPRPIVAAELEKYGDYFADYCMVKPGLTGLWQVSGRSTIDYPERVRLDRRYARNWSIGRDIYILLKTVRVVIKGEGAF